MGYDTENRGRLPFRRRERRGQAGTVMVQALVVLAGLVALMAVLAANQHTALEVVQNRMRERRAELAARSAVARALASIADVNTGVVTLNDDWAQLGSTGGMVYDMGDGTSTFRVQVVDASGLINVNTVTQQQLALLPLTQEQQDSLLDWIQTGTTPRAEGAKDDYYNGLAQPQSLPQQTYNAKLGRINSLSDLMLIRGWTARTLLYPQTDTVSTAVTLEDSSGNPLPLVSVLTADGGVPNQTAAGAQRTNLSRPTTQALQRLGITGNLASQLSGQRFTSFSQILGRPGIGTAQAQAILNAATFTNAARQEGKINLNTATLPVLESVPNVTPDIASAIVQQQEGNGFQQLGDLASISGLTGGRLAQVADRFGVGSDTWIVRAYGASGGIGVAVEAVIGIRNQMPQIVSWNRLPNPSIPTWWSWTAAPTETADAGDSQTNTAGATGSGGNITGGNR